MIDPVLAPLLALLAAAGPSPEAGLCARSLRPGELERLEAVLGPLDAQSLTRAELELDVGRRTLKGQVYLRTRALAVRAESLALRLTANAVAPGAVKLSRVKVQGQAVKVDGADSSLVEIPLPPSLPPGSPVLLEARLEALIPRAAVDSDALSAAMGTEDFGLLSAAPEVVNLAGVLPGVLATDRVDEKLSPSGLGDLASFAPSGFLVTVVAPRGWRVLASGALIADAPLPDGRGRFTYALAGGRDLGLLAVKGYRSETRVVDGVTVESWAQERDQAPAKRMLEAAAGALGALEAHLGPSPYATLRVVESRLTGGAGGAEFPGLVTISTALLRGTADPLESLGLPPLKQLKGFQTLAPALQGLLGDTLEFTVEHEVAHQYFAMLVGSDPVEHAVVDEALAQHAALLAHEWRHGKSAAAAVRQLQLTTGYQVFRFFGGQDAAADRPTAEFESASAYGALVYSKAPLLLDRQRDVLGDEAWTEALKRYVETYRWRVADPTALTRVAQTLMPKQTLELEQLRLRYWDEAHGDEDLGRLGAGLQGPLAAPGLDRDTTRLLEEAIRALQGQ